MENQKFYVSFWLNPSRQKDGASKLFIRIAIDGKRSEIATTHYVKKIYWDAKKGRVKNSSPQAVLINGFIDHVSNVIQKHFLQHAAMGKPITTQQLKDLFVGKKEKVVPKTLLDAFEYHRVKMESMIKVGKVAKTTLAKYNYC